MIVLGQWFSSICVYAASFRTGDSAWRIPLITQLIMPGLLLLIGIPLLPESPAWLVMHDRHDDAIKALKAFNGKDYDADLALRGIQAAIDMESENKIQQKNSTWAECFRQPNLRRTIIICMVYLSQQFIGVNFVSGYLTYYFSLAGVKNPLAIGQAAFAIQLFGNICSWPLIERLGRRPMLVYGCTIMTALLLLIGCINIRPNAASLKATVALMCIWGWLVSNSFHIMSISANICFLVSCHPWCGRVRRRRRNSNPSTPPENICCQHHVSNRYIMRGQPNLALPPQPRQGQPGWQDHLHLLRDFASSLHLPVLLSA